MTKAKTPKRKMVRMHQLVTEREKNHLQMLANTYAGGNLTAWLVYGGMNAPRKYLSADEVKRK